MCTYTTIRSHTDHFEILKRDSEEILLTFVNMFCSILCRQGIQYAAFRSSGSVAVHSLFSGCLYLASPRENLSSGFPAKRDSNQSHQLQRLARKLKFHL